MTVIDWLAMQPIVVAALVAGIVTITGAVIAVRGVLASVGATDRATGEDRQTAYMQTLQKDVESLREIHGATETRLDEMSARMTKMQSDLWECLQERNTLRVQIAGCDQRIKDVETQMAQIRREHHRG